eukprot:2966104-Prymnesium_polylepis.1
MTPLHWATWYNNAAEIEELLVCGADPSLRCRFHRQSLTPLELARKLGNHSAAVALEEVNAHVMPDETGDRRLVPCTAVKLTTRDSTFRLRPLALHAMMLVAPSAAWC